MNDVGQCVKLPVVFALTLLERDLPLGAAGRASGRLPGDAEMTPRRVLCGALLLASGALRAEPVSAYAFLDVTTRAMQDYVASRGNGLPIETPAVRF